MVFKNVLLTKDESVKWAEYFSRKYPTGGGFIKDYRTWSGLTVNGDQSIFIETERVNHDDPYDIDLFYFWHGQLFSFKMRQVWGEEDLEAWEFKRLMSYPELNYDYGIHLPQTLEKNKEQILKDLKVAMTV